VLLIRALSPEDLPFATSLVNVEGWGRTEAKWHRLLRIGRRRGFVAVEDVARAGIGFGHAYRRTGWVHAVIVDHSYRGRGIGARLMDDVLFYLRGCGVESV